MLLEQVRICAISSCVVFCRLASACSLRRVGVARFTMVHVMQEARHHLRRHKRPNQKCDATKCEKANSFHKV